MVVGKVPDMVAVMVADMMISLLGLICLALDGQGNESFRMKITVGKGSKGWMRNSHSLIEFFSFTSSGSVLVL